MRPPRALHVLVWLPLLHGQGFELADLEGLLRGPRPLAAQQPAQQQAKHFSPTGAKSSKFDPFDTRQPKQTPANPDVAVASFIAIGDWGYVDYWRAYHERLEPRGFPLHPNWYGFHDMLRFKDRRVVTPGCQVALARKMAAEARRLENSSKPVRFVANAGDNFYPMGLGSVDDQLWETVWGKVYSELPAGLPWYSVYGNHDYGQMNRACGCELRDAGDKHESTDGGHTCVQVLKHGQSAGGQLWYMPQMSYRVRPLKNVNLEIVVLDLNILDPEPCALSTMNRNVWNPPEASWREPRAPGCGFEQCQTVMYQRAVRACRLLLETVQEAEKTGAQVMVISHYPTSFLRGRSFGGIKLDKVLSSKAVKIFFVGAHVHSTDASKAAFTGKATLNGALSRPGWGEVCVGGGGGWACDGRQGFVMGEVMANGEVKNVRLVMGTDEECCQPAREQTFVPSPDSIQEASEADRQARENEKWAEASYKERMAILDAAKDARQSAQVARLAESTPGWDDSKPWEKARIYLQAELEAVLAHDFAVLQRPPRLTLGRLEASPIEAYEINASSKLLQGDGLPDPRLKFYAYGLAPWDEYVRFMSDD